jgi:hypothetical protein
MRNITAQELKWLEEFMREQGKEAIADSYKQEEEELQIEFLEVKQIEENYKTLITKKPVKFSELSKDRQYHIKRTEVKSNKKVK